MMVPFVLDSAAKYLGYLLGKNYKKLPLAIVKKMQHESEVLAGERVGLALFSVEFSRKIGYYGKRIIL